MSCPSGEDAKALANCLNNARQVNPDIPARDIAYVKTSGGNCVITNLQGDSESNPYYDFNSCMGGSAVSDANYPCNFTDIYPNPNKAQDKTRPCYDSSQPPQQQQENYMTVAAPWSRPTNYLNLDNTWSVQKKYQL